MDGNTPPRAVSVPGFIWDSVECSSDTWKSLSEAWDFEGTASYDGYKEMIRLFRGMVRERHTYDDRISIFQLDHQKRFLEAISFHVNWVKHLPKDTLRELILHITAAREQCLIYRQKNPMETYKPDSVLALSVQQFMDLYKIRIDNKLLSQAPVPKAGTPGLIITSPHKKIFGIKHQVKASEGNKEEIGCMEGDIALAICTKRRMSGDKSRRHVKRISNGGKSMTLPLRPKETSAEKKKG